MNINVCLTKEKEIRSKEYNKDLTGVCVCVCMSAHASAHARALQEYCENDSTSWNLGKE